MVFKQHGLLPTWTINNMVNKQHVLLSKWSINKMVFYRQGLETILAINNLSYLRKRTQAVLVHTCWCTHEHSTGPSVHLLLVLTSDTINHEWIQLFLAMFTLTR